MSNDDKQERKRGRPPGTTTGVRKYAVSLDPFYAEWAKTQPGGLSETIRRLLKEAYDRTLEAR